jgi:hypothetical protein
MSTFSGEDQLVVNMLATGRPPWDLRLPVLWLRNADYPLRPIPGRRPNRGVEAALPMSQAGRGVLAYCQGARQLLQRAGQESDDPGTLR